MFCSETQVCQGPRSNFEIRGGGHIGDSILGKEGGGGAQDTFSNSLKFYKYWGARSPSPALRSLFVQALPTFNR